VAHEIGRATKPGSPPALTPLAAHCIGSALAGMLHDAKRATMPNSPNDDGGTPAVSDGDGHDSAVVTIAVGIDPRPHGMRLADALARGAEAVSRTRVVYTGIATTPACASFTGGGGVDAAVMVTASHLPVDRNGFKIFPHWSRGGSVSRDELRDLGRRAKHVASKLFEQMAVPATSGNQALFCSEWVDYMPRYKDNLKGAIARSDKKGASPLEGLSIVLNAGNGSGGFFAKVLSDLGADVSGSVHLEPDAAFPVGIPNPEYKPMIDETIRACQQARADLGIMLDTDADRCGFVVPMDRSYTAYEPLHRNRLIALIGVMFSQSHPGCAIVTDSVTSEGLTLFLNKLGLQHVRYLKGYANVINKAKELTESGVCDAQVGMETSGHCAMRENGYLDDGTYTAAKVVSLLAQRRDLLLNSWIADYRDLPEVSELRMSTFDQSLDTMRSVFDVCAIEIELEAAEGATSGGVWEVDRENLEGIRVRVGGGQFFMLRKSLHDPIVSLQIEARSIEHARRHMVDPLIRIFEADDSSVAKSLDLSPLREYGKN
jgi:phosphomannomutase